MLHHMKRLIAMDAALVARENIKAKIDLVIEKIKRTVFGI